MHGQQVRGRGQGGQGREGGLLGYQGEEAQGWRGQQALAMEDRGGRGVGRRD